MQCWGVAKAIKDPAEFIACAEVWIEYPAKYFGSDEVNEVLGDIIEHVTPDRAFENLYGQLLSVIQKVELPLLWC